MLSEPLTLLVMFASLALTVLAPAFHYHQFGEATRMARDAGFSAVLVGGGALAVFGTIRVVRREIESGTLEMALARPVSRGLFFIAKALGAWFAAVVVATTVFMTMLCIVEGAAVGGRIAESSGDVARLWGPSVAAGVGVVVVPALVAAALDRFARFRFVLAAVGLAVGLALAIGIWALVRDFRLLSSYFPAILPLSFLLAVWVTTAASLAFALRTNAAAALSGLVVACCLPFVGNYYLADVLANGGAASCTQVAGAALAALPAVVAFLLLGCRTVDCALRSE